MRVCCMGDQGPGETERRAWLVGVTPHPVGIDDVDDDGNLALVLAAVDQDHPADLDKPREDLDARVDFMRMSGGRIGGP